MRPSKVAVDILHFPDKKMKAQTRDAMYPMSPSSEVAEVGFELGVPGDYLQ